MASNANAPIYQFNNLNGTPMVGGFIYSYLAGTDTPNITYQDYTASIENTNPIELDNYGLAKIWIVEATKLILKDPDGVTIWTVDNLQASVADIFDDNGKLLIHFVGVTDATNYFTITNSAAGNPPILGVNGLDVNIAIDLLTKGTGAVLLGSPTSSGVVLQANQPLLDNSNNELLKFTKVASAINEITISNNSIGLSPSISVTGGDTNINVVLQSKGTGAYQLLGTATQRGQLDLFEQTTNGTNKITFRGPAAITTDHALTFDGGGTDRTLTFGGNLTTGGTFTTTGTFSQTGAYTATAAVSFTGAVTTAGAFTTAAAFTQAGAFTTTITSTATTNSTLPAGTKTLVPNDLTLTAAGLVTGGGDLSTNRTFTVTAASKSDQITGTSTTTVVTPAQQSAHRSACQAWVRYTSITTATIISSYNITSVTDGAAGNTTVNYAITMSDALYAITACGGDGRFIGPTSAGGVTTTTALIITRDNGAITVDTFFNCIAIHGTLA